ncbi:helix-turn-helix domain-containing protein [Aquimarina rhabdastrellae]
MKLQEHLQYIEINKVSNLFNSKIVLSKFNQFSNKKNDSPLSIKMVLEGEECYQLNKQYYRLKKNNYIIVNQGENFEVTIDSKQTTNGLCIYPPIAIINDVFSSCFLNRYTNVLDNVTDIENLFFTTHRYNINYTSFGKYIKSHLYQILNAYKNDVDFHEFYCGLAESMIGDQIEVEKKLIELQVSKRQTREELFRRLSIVREYIHENQDEIFSLEKLSQLSNLSKYHFTRSFKQLYKKSPYQYVLTLKLMKAQQLKEKGYSFKEISDSIGFSDVKNLKKKLRNF